MAGAIARPPQLRGLGYSYGIRCAIISSAAIVVIQTYAWFAYNRPRKQAYEHFMKTADPYKMMQKICETNAFESCPGRLAEKK